MSAVRTVTEGQHMVMVAPAAEFLSPPRVSLPAVEPSPGLILPSGEINWACPCLGGMAAGPCGPAFREAFSCFHYSTAEPKGSECYEKFSSMQQCMSQYPELYGRDDDDDEEVETPPGALAGASTGAPDADKKP